MRLLCGLNQEELASKAGVPRPSLGNYEQGTYVPRDKSLERIAAILGVEPGYVRYGSPILRLQIWKPNLPANARRNRETIEDILKLIPEFIRENRFTGLLTGNLADGNSVLVFGREKNFDCLLLTSKELARNIANAVSELIKQNIEANLFGAIDTFDVECLSCLSMQIENMGMEFDFIALRQRLTRLTALKTRTDTNLDAVALMLDAQYDELSREILLELGDYACRRLFEQSLEQIAESSSSPTIDVSSYSNLQMKSLCIYAKAAYDLLAKERNLNPSFPPNPK